MSICDGIEEGAFTVEESKFTGFESWKCCKIIQVCCSIEEKDPCNKSFNFSHLKGGIFLGIPKYFLTKV